MFEDHQRDNVARGRKVGVCIELSLERFQVESLIRNHVFRLGRVCDDCVTHVPDRTASTRHVPPAPALLERATVVSDVVASLANSTIGPPGTQPTATDSLKKRDRGLRGSMRSIWILVLEKTIICDSIGTLRASRTDRR